jgi:hypothetical protein
MRSIMRPRLAPFAAAALILAAGVPAWGQADDAGTLRYTVQAGDTCMGVARRFYGDAGRYHVIHRANPKLGPTPHTLAPGSVLILPGARKPDESAPDARITDLQRRVTSRAPRDESWSLARRGQELFRAWRVNTEDRSSAEITFRDTSTIAMRENTLVIIYGGARQQARRLTTQATLERGTLRSYLGQLAGDAPRAGGPRLEVTTPSARAGLGAGQAVVDVDGGGATGVSNHAGAEASVKGTRGAAVKVRRGMGTSVKPRAAAAPPTPLPAAPPWEAGPTTFAALAGAGATISGSWQPVARAARYRVEVAQGADGRSVLAAATVPAGVTRFEVQGLPPGAYHVAVAALDAASLESPPSVRRAIAVVAVRLEGLGGTVTAAASAPAGAGSQPAAAVTPPRPPRVVPGTRVVPPAGVSCALGAGAPRPTLWLERPGTATVRCRLEAGGDVAPFIVEIAPVAIRLATTGGPPPRLVRGRAAPLEVQVECDLPVAAGVAVSVPAGVVATAPERLGGGRWRTLLTAGAGTADRVAASVALARGPGEPPAPELLSVTLPVAAPPPVTAPVALPPPRPAPRPAQESSGLAATSRFLGLRDEQREGLRAFVAGLGNTPAGGSGEGTGFTLGVDARGRVLHGSAAVAIDTDFGSPQRHGTDQPTGVVALEVGARLLRGPRLGLEIDVGIRQPLGDSSYLHTLVVPTVDVSARFGRLTLRSRQGAMVEAGGEAARLWASAYGIDLRLGGPLSLAVEANLAVGVLAHEAAFGRGGAFLLAFDYYRFTAVAGMRLLSSDFDTRRLLGKTSFVFGAQIAF